MNFLSGLGNLGSVLGGAAVGLEIKSLADQKGKNATVADCVNYDQQTMTTNINQYLDEMKKMYSNLGIEMPGAENFEKMYGLLSIQQQEDMRDAMIAYNTKQQAYQQKADNQVSRYKEDLESAKSDIFQDYHYNIDPDTLEIERDEDGYPKCIPGGESEIEGASELRSRWETKNARDKEDAEIDEALGDNKKIVEYDENNGYSNFYDAYKSISGGAESGKVKVNGQEYDASEVKNLAEHEFNTNGYNSFSDAISAVYSDSNTMMEFMNDSSKKVMVNGEYYSISDLQEKASRESQEAQLKKDADELVSTTPSILKGLVNGDEGDIKTAMNALSDEKYKYTRMLFDSYEKLGYVENGKNALDAYDENLQAAADATGYGEYLDIMNNGMMNSQFNVGNDYSKLYAEGGPLYGMDKIDLMQYELTYSPE